MGAGAGGQHGAGLSEVQLPAGAVRWNGRRNAMVPSGFRRAEDRAHRGEPAAVIHMQPLRGIIHGMTNCYQCRYFAEFKVPRQYVIRDAKIDIYGMCCEAYGKNGSYQLYPVYVPLSASCKQFSKRSKQEAEAALERGKQ